ncbi:MAG: hypothetical protein RSB70_01840 [Clostridium sp.]
MKSKIGKTFGTIIVIFLIALIGVTVVNVRVTRNLYGSYEYDGVKMFFNNEPFTFAIDFGDYYFKLDKSGINKITENIVNVFKNDN